MKIKHVDESFIKRQSTSLVLLCSVCPCVLLFILFPLGAYFSNISEFSETWIDVIMHFFPVSAICFILMAFLLFVLRRKSGKCYFLSIFSFIALSILFVTQTYFLNNNLPQLDGDFSFYFASIISIRSLCETAFLIAVLCVCIYFWKKTISNGIVICSLCLAISMANVLAVASRAERMASFQYSFSNIVDSAVFSDEKNTIILSLDMVDARVAAEVIAESPEIEENLSGFTNFVDNIAAHSLTYHALPALMHGELFDGLSYREHFDKMLKSENSIIKKHIDNGYLVFSYLHDGMTNLPSLKAKQNNKSQDFHARGLLKWSLFEFVLFEMCPLMFKYNLLESIEKASDTRKSTQDKGGEITNIYERTIYPRLIAKVDHVGKTPALNIYHTMGGHVPFYIYGDRTLRSDKPRWDDRDAYKEQIKAALLFVVDFLAALRKKDLYEKSVIAIVSDHGIGGKYGDLPGRASALCMVKPRDAKKPYSKSDFPMSSLYFPDLMNALCFSQNSIEALADFERAVLGGSRIFRHLAVDDIIDTVVNIDGTVETIRKPQPTAASSTAEQWELGKEYSTSPIGRGTEVAPRYVASGFDRNNEGLKLTPRGGKASGKISIRVPSGIRKVDLILRSVLSGMTGKLTIVNSNDGFEHVESLSEDIQKHHKFFDIAIPSLTVSDDNLLNLEFDGVSTNGGYLEFRNWRLLDSSNRLPDLAGGIDKLIYTDDGYVEIEGRAFDDNKAQSPAWYSVEVNGREIMSFTFPFRRDDVAYALENSNFTLSGFMSMFAVKESEVKSIAVHAGADMNSLQPLNTYDKFKTRFQIPKGLTENKSTGNVKGWIDKIGTDNSAADALLVNGWAGVDDGEGSPASAIAVVINGKTFAIEKTETENANSRAEFHLRLPCTWDKSLPVAVRVGESRFFSMEIAK